MIGIIQQPLTIDMLALQGVAGSIPFQALVFFTLYFQLLGFSNFIASALMSGFLFATAFGGLLGGWIGDKSAPLLCCPASEWHSLHSITAGSAHLLHLAVVETHCHNLPCTTSRRQATSQGLWTYWLPVVLLIAVQLLSCGAVTTLTCMRFVCRC